jgi:hypothetical protein
VNSHCWGVRLLSEPKYKPWFLEFKEKAYVNTFICITTPVFYQFSQGGFIPSRVFYRPRAGYHPSGYQPRSCFTTMAFYHHRMFYRPSVRCPGFLQSYSRYDMILGRYSHPTCSVILGVFPSLVTVCLDT